MNLDEINKNLGIKLFNNPNTLNYNLFNYFFKLKIVNRINNDDLIKNYHELGFAKPKLNFSLLANCINENLKKNKFEQQKDLSNNYSIYLQKVSIKF